jgi:O-antigen/teichoic acid export membrane protein
MNLRKNSLAVSIGGVIRLVVNLAAIPLLIRLLGIENYGIWTTVNAQIGLLTLAEMGVSTAMLFRLSGFVAVQEDSSIERSLNTGLIMVVLFGFIISLLYFVLIPLIAKTYGSFSSMPGLRISLQVSAFVILPKIVSLYFSSIEAAYQRYDLQAIIETVTTILLQAGTVIIAWQKGGLPALLIWLLLSMLACNLAHYVISTKSFKIKFNLLHFSLKEAKSLWCFGIQHWVSSIGSSLFGQMDRILVNAIVGPAASGVYSAATSLAIKINELSAIPVKVITPSVSSELAKRNFQRIQLIYGKATRLNGAIVLLVALPLIFWADWVARIMVTNDSVAAFTTILPILAFIYGIYSLGASGFFLMLGLGKPKVNAIYGIIGGLFLCAAMIPLASKLGVLGAAWANAAYIIVIAINLQGAKDLKLPLGKYALVLSRFAAILAIWLAWSVFVPPASLSLGWRIVVFFVAGILSILLAVGTSELKELCSWFSRHFLRLSIDTEKQ